MAPKQAGAPGNEPVVDILDTGRAGLALIRGGTLRTAAYALGILLSLASVPLMTRHLGPVDFGRFVTAVSILAVAGGISEAGLTSIGLREFAAPREASRLPLMRTLLGMRTLFTTLGIAGAVAFAALAGYPRVLVLGTLIGGAGLMVNQLRSLFLIPLEAGLRLGWVALVELLNQGAVVALIALLVIIGAGLLPFFGAALGGALVAMVVTTALVRETMTFRPEFDFERWRVLLRDLLPYIGASLIGAIPFRVVLITLSLAAPARPTGYFSVAYRTIEILGGLVALLVVSAFPIMARAARDASERLHYALQRMFEVAILCGFGLAVLVGVGAPFAVDVAAGPRYDAAVPLLQIQAPVLITQFLLAIVYYALISLHLHKGLLLLNSAALLSSIALSVLLIPSYGATGAAVAVLVQGAVATAIAGLILMRAEPALRVRLGTAPRAALAGGIAALAGVLAPIPSPAALSLAAVIYVSLVIGLRAVPREVLDALPRRRNATPDFGHRAGR